MKSILIQLHCESNTGYAIGPLEATFYRMAVELCSGDATRVHFAYPSMQKGPSDTLPAEFTQYAIIDTRTRDEAAFGSAAGYLRTNNIDTVFGFDQPVSLPIYKHLRNAGMKHFISYWGAPMSSLFGGVRLLLKRMDVAFRRHGPDHYIFESQGMAETAVSGRGIPRRKTSVVFQGVDVAKYRPRLECSEYVREQFAIPSGRRIFFYAGHMEHRKGVHVIMRAANRLAAARKKDDWHVVLLGNKPGEEQPHVELLEAAARDRVTFGGYRHDLHLLQPGCYAAILASTGWDSFPRTGVEMQSCGLPLLVSELPGLRELVVPEVTGFRFAVGSDEQLSMRMMQLLDAPEVRDKLSSNARNRAVKELSLDAQLESLIAVVRAATA